MFRHWEKNASHPPVAPRGSASSLRPVGDHRPDVQSQCHITLVAGGRHSFSSGPHCERSVFRAMFCHSNCQLQFVHQLQAGSLALTPNLFATLISEETALRAAATIDARGKPNQQPQLAVGMLTFLRSRRLLVELAVAFPVLPMLRNRHLVHFVRHPHTVALE